VIAYHYDRGEINGVNVAGLTLAMSVHIPGQRAEGNWKVAVFVDSKANAKQREAILAAHTGKLGGPLAGLAPLIGEVLGVYDVPIQFNMAEGRRSIRVGDATEQYARPEFEGSARPALYAATGRPAECSSRLLGR
jgi:hypothetical protein